VREEEEWESGNIVKTSKNKFKVTIYYIIVIIKRAYNNFIALNISIVLTRMDL
jgi:hypothetical protein